ncbi:N-6 DNA methylase [Halomonadaceae bacterium KBTZ08]
MQETEVHAAIRDEARAYERALSSSRRKELGQFFSGMQLGRLLAHLAVERETKNILDPMAGNGDLLDAASEAATANEAQLERLDAIEIDETSAAICERRLQHICRGQTANARVVFGDAFNLATHNEILESGYDLVITNPPYVRYQALNGRGMQVRGGLANIVDQRSDSSHQVWRALTKGYSGLADLSVPAWLLSAFLVKPEGRLALVVPATWRSRGYADAIRYLLLRCFQLELIVEDSQQGWFSDALVRTHLIVARRLPEGHITEPLNSRASWPTAFWVQVSPEAASSQSLVGKAFCGGWPEFDFAAWCRDPAERSKLPGINGRFFSLEEEWHALSVRAARSSWMKALEQRVPDRAQVMRSNSAAALLPEALRDITPKTFNLNSLCMLSETGICTGQGLRTGCNRFFYVRLIHQDAEKGTASIVTDESLGGRTLNVPITSIKPVLHRQADLESWCNGILPNTRVLDLRRMILPENMEEVRVAVGFEYMHKDELPVVMPEDLAAHVRTSGETTLGNGVNAVPISAMSAVKTNVRSAKAGAMPRFWYMLPDFKPRHLAQAFVPRIINDAPQVFSNTEPAVLIDANFSTFWTQQEAWSPAGLTAFLNSSWCRAVMEAAGTPLGGGGLKLEAAHLRKMPVPYLKPSALESLNKIGERLHESEGQRQIDRIILHSVLSDAPSETEIDAFAARLNERRAALGAARQKGAV